jgi:uncharacterized protein (DUF2252 family)
MKKTKSLQSKAKTAKQSKLAKPGTRTPKRQAKSTLLKASSNPRHVASTFAIQVLSVSEREAQGKTFRDIVSRSSHAAWSPADKQRDPVQLLEDSNIGRIRELIPIRYGRMIKSPFTFFRGSAAIMAADLSLTPTTGMMVQACGDCHLLNFGAFGTPERGIIVDINDFDETLPAPWEWDLKRLATSFVLACRGNGFKPSTCKEVAETCARSYRTAMLKLADTKVLDVWYSRLDLSDFIKDVGDKETRSAILSAVEKERLKSSPEYLVPRITTEENGVRRFKDIPPFIYHAEDQHEKDFVRIVNETFETYKLSLSHDRQVLINRYQVADIARKIVGIGSVGTLCAVLLLFAAPDDPLILQVKEARASVLEPYVGKSAFSNHGHRVVVGQRLMQSQSDIFLGWTTGAGKMARHFYLRQLRDLKMSLVPESWTPSRATEVARALGWVLARAHARSGDAALIGGYLGSKDVFDQAISEFAVAYADQTERDHKVLVSAVRKGRVEAFVER